MDEVIIRPYKKEERNYIRDIAWGTAFMGESADIFFADKEIFADFLTLYFTDYEPESCFVAEVNNSVVGYLIGAKNINLSKRVFLFKIAPRLFTKVLLNGLLFKKKNLIFFFYYLLSFFKGEFKKPDFSKLYPATLHINLSKGFRGLGIGSRLIAAYLDYLSKEKIPGVLLATMSEKASSFFVKQGFELLNRSRRSYFKYILHKDIPIYIYGKLLLL